MKFYKNIFPAFISVLCFQQFSFAADLLLLPSLSWQGGKTADEFTNESEAKIDIFYTQHTENWSVLAEGLLSTEERELERIELGWHIDALSTLWFGRFHNPISFWITNFHHGSFVQTALSSPHSVAWEDDAGIFSTHITGVHYQYDHYAGDAKFSLDLAGGLGPKANDNLLFEPFNVLEPSSDQGRAYTASLNFFPDAINENFIGLGINRNEVKPGVLLPNGMTQTITALRGQIFSGPWRTFGELYFIEADINGQRDNFYSFYVQTEYAVEQSFTVYGRHEKTANYAENSYVFLMADFHSSTQSVGLNMQVADDQAVKVELAIHHDVYDVVNRTIGLEWSMKWQLP